MIKASSRIIALLYIGPEDTVRAAVTTQIPSTSGGYVGQEFLFIQLTAPLYIHAFEDAEVRAYNAEGKELGRITLGQNDTKEFKIAGVKPGDVIRISSTGRIAAAQVADQGMMFAVDATGRFKGNNLFGGHYETRGHIILLAYQPCKAVVYLGREKAKIGEHVFTDEEVFKNKYWTMARPRTSLYWITSTGNVSALVGEGDLGNTPPDMRGVAFAAICSGETFKTYAPSGIVIFPTAKGTVRIGEEAFQVDAGQPMVLYRGAYEITATMNLVIEALGNGEQDPQHPMSHDGEYLLPDKDVGLNLGPPKPGVKRASEQPWLQIITIVIIATATVLVLKKRGGRRTK